MDSHEDTGMKRKNPPSTNGGRPNKHSRLNGDTEMSDAPVRNGVLEKELDDDAQEEDLPLVPTQDTPEWQATIENVISKVVSIHFCQTAPFDTEGACASEATGFIVDSEKGYIMTNRHVVGPGPFSGYVVLNNHEEVDVYPVYRDPVHDFGILRFDPKAIKYMTLSHLVMAPELARVGCEIRVVGNDAGERLSILSGILSRLDRNAPEYSEGYNDFNVAYLQAAASATGGSSGSPVIERSGKVVALQAGGRADGAATDFFLPLDRPLRALECIKRGAPVTRGTIQTQWLLKPFDEARRLGLTARWESEVRAKFPKENNMLVAEVVLPQGPAHSKIEEGDVLIKVNDELLTQFTKLDEILDDNVGSDVKLLVQRGGVDFEVVVTIGDLHDITPDRYLNVAGASFHDLSYQQARFYAVSLKGNGVFCSSASSSFKVDPGCVIQTVDDKATPDLASLIEVMKSIPDRKRVVVTYKALRDMHTLNTGIFYIDRHWHSKMTMVVRNDKTGLWDYDELFDAVPPEAPKPSTGRFGKMDGYQNQAAVDVIRSFVRVSVTIPLKLDGFPWSSPQTGWGLVVDADAGLVVTSRAVVPSDLLDVSVTIADSIIVDAKVVFLHPLQNYAILQYDPKVVQAPVKSATLATRAIKQGEETIFFGFNHNHTPVAVNTAVSEVSSVTIPGNTMPRYRAVNLDAISVETQISHHCSSGCLVDKNGTVQALWLTYLGDRRDGKDSVYRLGMATPSLLPVLSQIKGGKKPDLHILNLETHPLQMHEARIRGVPDEWVQRVHSESDKHQLFMVRKLDADNPDGGFKEGDIILTLNGQLVTRVADFDVMYSKESLDAVIVRRKKQMELKVPTILTTDLETDRAVLFCGAIIQAPHHAVRQQISKLHSKVYCSGRVQGSPAYMYGLAQTNFITHVNGVSTQTLDEFVREARKIPNNTYFRLKLMTFDNLPWVITMKKNEHYFPMQEFVRDETVREGWKRIKYENGKAKEDEGDMPDGIEDTGAAESAEA